MKKIILFILLFIPIFLNASNMDYAYIDSEVDIAGNLIVNEIVSSNNYDKPINLYYLNDIEEDIYNSSNIDLKSICILPDDYKIEEFYNDDFESKYCKNTSEYSTIEDNGYLNITLDKKGTYLIKYTVLNLSVLYDDASEFYYAYLNNFNYEINNLTIITRFQGISNLFKTYAYGQDSNIKVDKEKSIIQTNIKNYKTGIFKLRVFYDKDLFPIVINSSKIYEGSYKDKINSPWKIILIVICSILIIRIISSIIYSHKKIDVTRYNISNDKIDTNKKILVLSDLHDRDINDEIVRIVKKEKVDAIFIAGDAVDGNYETINIFLNLCDKLKGENIYYTCGNHETKLDIMFDRYLNLVRDKGVNIINNDHFNLSKNVVIYGLFQDISFYKRIKHVKIPKKYINEKLGNINSDKYNVLIAHNPLNIKDYEKCGFDLTISGHVHGGMIRLPFLGGILSPEYKFFPKYDAGLYKTNDMISIVSRGIGYGKFPPFRINNPAEIVIINIMKNE